MIELDDDHLARVLASVGERLLTDPVAESTGALAAPSNLLRRRRQPRLLLAAAVLVAVIATVVAVTPLRRAVADWLGIGSTRVEIDPAQTTDLTGLPSIDDGLTPIDRDTAETRLGRPLPDVDGTPLGEPAGYAVMPEGGVLVVWPDSSTLWIYRPTIDSEALFVKLATAGETVQPIDDLGDDALVISGDHILETPHRTVRATTTVLWQKGAVQLRLETDRDVTEAIELARGLEG